MHWREGQGILEQSGSSGYGCKRADDCSFEESHLACAISSFNPRIFKGNNIDTTSILRVLRQMKHLHDVLCRALIFSILTWVLLLSASAERIEYCDFIPEDYVDWDSNVSLLKFDPAMGSLKAVDLVLTINLSKEVMIENTNSNSGNFTSNLTGSITALLPSSESVSVSINNIQEGNLSAYDGSADFGGPSGFKSVSQVPTNVAAVSISNIDDFLAGLPGESITIPVRAKISSQTSMPGSSSSGVMTLAGAKVCITYTYDAKAEGDGMQ
jgi:hypothetical protein